MKVTSLLATLIKSFFITFFFTLAAATLVFDLSSIAGVSEVGASKYTISLAIAMSFSLFRVFMPKPEARRQY